MVGRSRLKQPQVVRISLRFQFADIRIDAGKSQLPWRLDDFVFLLDLLDGL